MRSELPLLVAMCFLGMVGTIVLRHRPLQLAALALTVAQVGMTICYVMK